MRLPICILLAGWAAWMQAAPPEAPPGLGDTFPFDHSADAVATLDEFNQSAGETVAMLVQHLSSTQAADRVAAEYALDGWTTSVLCPGARGSERVALAAALADAVMDVATGSEPNATGAFLVSQLGKVGTPVSMRLLAGMLRDPAWAEPASLALQACALPAYAAPVRNAVEAALSNADGPHRETLLHLLHRSRDPDPAPWWRTDLARRDPAARARALRMSRRQIAEYQPGDPAHRVCAALIVLNDLAGDDAFPEIAAAIDHDDPSVRATARELLSGCSAEEVAPWLLDRLRDQDPERRAEALILLTQGGHREAFDRALPLMKDESEVVRRAAYDARAALGGDVVVGELLAAYTTAEKNDRSALLNALLLRRGPGIADEAHARLASSSDPRVREAMLNVIETCMAREYIEDALGAIRAEDQRLAKQAVRTTRRLVAWEQAATLLDMLQDPGLDPAVRSSLVPALVVALNEAADAEGRVGLIRDVLVRTEGGTRQNLHRVLSGLNAPEAVALLKADTTHPDEATRDTAVRALCKWNGFEAADALQDVAGSTTDGTHNALALRRLVQLVQQHRTGDDNEEYREDARRRYEAALAVAMSDEDKDTIREALDGLAPEPETVTEEDAP